jgi:hypothetical protein
MSPIQNLLADMYRREVACWDRRQSRSKKETLGSNLPGLVQPQIT